jgi:hypothetical protein
MSDCPKSQNDRAWELLFEKYNILSHIETEGKFVISASQIKEFREPRLMAKFDHTINLPCIFKKYDLAILPISRGDYVISHFRAYQKFEEKNRTVEQATLPSYIQSLDENNISSEAIAINCAFASGMLCDFLEDEDLLPTVSGRMGSGQFKFNIQHYRDKRQIPVEVNNSQIEIDAAFEGTNSLSLIEAKRDLSDDFLVRQLYYPYRVWSNRITKKVRPVFLIYSNGIFKLYEYSFTELSSYNSLVLVKQKNYAIENMTIDVSNLQDIAENTETIPEPDIPFPQANSFERVINLCELLDVQDMSSEQVTEEYAFDLRQTGYYTNAARYLGLLERFYNDEHRPMYRLSSLGKYVMRKNYKQRQLAFSKVILQHKPFRDTFRVCMESGTMPDKSTIVSIMKASNIYKVDSEDTFERRSSTVRGWINWMLGLIEE